MANLWNHARCAWINKEYKGGGGEEEKNFYLKFKNGRELLHPWWEVWVRDVAGSLWCVWCTTRSSLHIREWMDTGKLSGKPAEMLAGKTVDEAAYHPGESSNTPYHFMQLKPFPEKLQLTSLLRGANAQLQKFFAVANLHYQLSWETKLSCTTNKGSPLFIEKFSVA